MLSMIFAAVLAISFFTVAVCADSNTVIYVNGAGNDSNAGTSSDKAVATLDRAYALLADGGTMVICGEVQILANYATPVYTKNITITSVYNSVDFRTAGAKLTVGANFYLNGDTVIENVNISVTAANKAIGCNSNTVVIGENVNCEIGASANALSLIAGSFDTTSSKCDDSKATNITVNSGTWNTFRGGNRATASSAVKGARVIINGGTFNGRVSGGGNSPVDGDVSFTINGGTFNKAVSASCINNESKGKINGNVTFTITGGTFADKVMLCDNYGDKVMGTGTLIIKGGEFGENTTILGANCTGDTTVKIGDYAKAADITAKISGFTTIDDTPTPAGGDNPNTGDVTTIVVVTMLISLGGIAILTAKKAKATK